MTNERRSAGLPRVWMLSIAAGVTLSHLPGARAAIAYATASSIYSQDFDSLPNAPENVNVGNSPAGWTDDNAAPGAGNYSIPGWYLYHPLSLSAGEGGFNGNQRVRIGAGSANTGSFMSFGSSGSTERALGDIGSNTLAPVGADLYIGLRLTNTTGTVLDSFTVSYVGEQWRDGGATSPATSVAQSMTFMWSTTATAISDPNSSFTAAPALDFTSPTFGVTAATALDGNLAANRTALGTTVTGVAWAPGTDLWLRWADINHTGNDHGMSIDDFSFTAAAIPEPTGIGLLALGAVALAGRRRRG